MPIEIEGPDGTVYEFPDGTGDDTIRSAMQRQYPKRQSAPSRLAPGSDEAFAAISNLANDPLTQRVGSFAAGGVNALTFGQGDRLNAKLSELGVPGGAPNPHGRNQLAAERDRRKDIMEEHPVSHLGGELTGFLAPGALVAKGISKLPFIPSMANTFRGAAAAGAVDGAVYGATVDTSNAEARSGEDASGTERAFRSLFGGTVGAVGGPVVKGVIDVGRVGARAVTSRGAEMVDALSRAFGGSGGAADAHAEEVAKAAVLRSVDRSGMTPQQILEAVEQYGDKPAVLAEVIGQDAVNALVALTRRPGTTSSKAQGIIAERADGYVDRVTDDIQAVTGLDTDAIAGNLQRMIAERQSEAAPLYQQAFEEFGDLSSRRLNQLLQDSPTIQKYMAAARKAVQDTAAVRGVEPQSLSNLELWDLVKREFDDAIESAMAKGERRTRTGESVAKLTEIKNSIVDELDKLTTVLDDGGNALSLYMQARNIGGEAPRLREAQRQGEAALRRNNIRPRDVEAQVSSLPDRDVPVFQAGMAQDIADRTADNTLKPQRFRIRSNQEKVRAGFGEEAGEEFLSRMEAEASLKDLGARWAPNTNSVTGTVLENGPSQLGDEIIGAGRDLAVGNKVGLVARMINVMRRQGYSQRQLDAMGDLLLSNPREGLQRLGIDIDSAPGSGQMFGDISLDEIRQKIGIGVNRGASFMLSGPGRQTVGRSSEAGSIDPRLLGVGGSSDEASAALISATENPTRNGVAKMMNQQKRDGSLPIVRFIQDENGRVIGFDGSRYTHADYAELIGLDPTKVGRAVAQDAPQNPKDLKWLDVNDQPWQYRSRANRDPDAIMGDAVNDSRLTPMENRVVAMRRAGMTNAEIAEEELSSPSSIAVLLSKARNKAPDLELPRATQGRKSQLTPIIEELEAQGLPDDVIAQRASARLGRTISTNQIKAMRWQARNGGIQGNEGFIDPELLTVGFKGPVTGGLTGMTAGAFAPWETPEELARNMTVGAGLGALTGGRVASLRNNPLQEFVVNTKLPVPPPRDRLVEAVERVPQRMQAIKLREQGLTDAQIAREMSVSLDTVFSWLKDAPPGPITRYSPDQPRGIAGN